MPNNKQGEEWTFPPPPDQPVQEGARWRWHRPSGEAVAAWFATQPLDDGMVPEHYVGGVVLIPQSEKVRYTRPDGATSERYEQVFTPYVQIGTRVGYARRLAEHRGLIYHTEAAPVPRSANPQSPYFNGNMPDGLWWHIVAAADGQSLRYLCATTNVGLYEPQSYAAKLRGERVLPLLGGQGTKQVGGGPDPNQIAKAQTGAIGRALGVAGILVIGTGIATVEDMQELPGYGATPVAPEPSLPATPSEIAAGEPPPVDPSAQLDQLRSRAQALQAQLQEAGAWGPVAAWWQERSRNENWNGLESVPYEGLKGVVAYMERALAEAS
ncbi:MAG: hypothetical protein ACJ780_09980 [Solirubrobacteraceae bacterium]|jgi:hypothetical protein